MSNISAPDTADEPQKKSTTIANFVARHRRAYQAFIWAVVIVSIVGGTMAWWVSWFDLQDVGYSGVFLVNLVGAAVCAGAAASLGLNFVILAMSGAIGSTIGEFTGYLAGYGSQGVIQKSRFYDRVHGWVVRRGGFALFTLALIPNPLFDIGGVAAGSLGYPLSRFFLWVGLGKLIKYLIVAYSCRQSISWFVDLV